jgi:hypothetical protein
VTLETYRTLEVGDEIHLTQKHRNWLVESMFEMHSVRGNILKSDTSIIQCATEAAGLYEKIIVIDLLCDVGGGDPRMRVRFEYSDGSSRHTVLGYDSVYQRRQ